MTVDNEQKPKSKPKTIKIGGSTAVNIGETTKFQPCMQDYILNSINIHNLCK